MLMWFLKTFIPYLKTVIISSKAVNQNNILEYLNYFEDDILDSEKNELKTILKQNDSIPFKVIIKDFEQEIVLKKRILSH